jgi:hypothetical protein
MPARSCSRARYSRGATVCAGSPTELDTAVVEQTEKWGKVIRAANIKAE